MCELCNVALNNEKTLNTDRGQTCRTGIAAGMRAGSAVRQGDGDGTVATPQDFISAPGVKPGGPNTELKRPTAIHAVVTVETPEKPKVKVRTMGIGQAIKLYSGNVIYRLGPDNYLYISPYNVSLHHTVETLIGREGEALPIGSKIIIRI